MYVSHPSLLVDNQLALGDLHRNSKIYTPLPSLPISPLTFFHLVSGAKGSWWLVTELHLGLLCPCLITFQPIFVYAYRGLLSRLSPHNRTRVTRFTGVDDDTSDRTAYESRVAGSDKSGLTRFETSSVNSKPSDLEAQKLAVHDENALPPRLPASMTDSDRGAGLEGIDKDASDRVQDHDVALANLKPPDRVHHQERGRDSSVRAEADVDRRV